MRIALFIIVLLFSTCRSETAFRKLTVETVVDIKLPSDAIFGNISSFSGFQTAVPDLFIEEHIEETNGHLIRTLKLSDQTILIDELKRINDDKKLISYITKSTSLPIGEMTHVIEVKKVSAEICQVLWTSNVSVQNQYRAFIDERITGIQESYLFTLELLGEDLEKLMKDSDF